MYLGAGSDGYGRLANLFFGHILGYMMIWEKDFIEAFVIFVKDVCSGYAIQNSITKVVELSESD